MEFDMDTVPGEHAGRAFCDHSKALLLLDGAYLWSGLFVGHFVYYTLLAVQYRYPFDFAALTL